MAIEKEKYRFTTSVLMRIGSREAIEKCYAKKTLSFGCAANWLDYALKYRNQTTGDIFECVFARLQKDDPRIATIVDSRGKPMGDHLLVLENIADNTCILRFMPTILTPVLCFYSFDLSKKREEMGIDGIQDSWLAFDLDGYRESMEYTVDQSSYLFITEPEKFIRELKEAIPLAVLQNSDNLTSERFYESFDANEPLIGKCVDYNRHTKDDIFFEKCHSTDELFWKLPEYEQQSELRLAIPHINFRQIYNPNFATSYDYRNNTLHVYLPHFQEYATIVSAKEAHSLYFETTSLVEGKGKFEILKMTMDEIREKAERYAIPLIYG